MSSPDSKLTDDEWDYLNQHGAIYLEDQDKKLVRVTVESTVLLGKHYNMVMIGEKVVWMRKSPNWPAKD